jgi:hypothetical protein
VKSTDTTIFAYLEHQGFVRSQRKNNFVKDEKLFARYTEQNTQESIGNRCWILPALTRIIRNDETSIQGTKRNCTYTITKFQQFLVISGNGNAQDADRGKQKIYIIRNFNR